MATTVIPSRGETVTTAAPVRVRTIKPVKWWAGLGAFLVLLQLWVYGQWIAQGDATPTPIGPSKVPHWMKVTLNAHLVAGLIAFVLFLWFCLIRPWYRTRRISFDGLLCFAMLAVYWQDPWGNANGYFYTYNSYIFNLGSWANHLPFYNSQHGNLMPESFVMNAPTYIYMMIGGAMVGNILMRKAKARWPEIGKFGLIMVAVAFCLVVDLIMEVFWLRIGYYTYAGAPHFLLAFQGKYYQFPIWEVIIWTATWTGYTCLRYFKNDKGESVVERGVGDIRAPAWQKTWLRGLALAGIANAIMFFGYMLPSWIIGPHAGGWPADITQRSYLTNLLCGPSTDYACGSAEIPNFRARSAHITPNGELVVPEGTKLPCQAPAEKHLRPSPGCQ